MSVAAGILGVGAGRRPQQEEGKRDKRKLRRRLGRTSGWGAAAPVCAQFSFFRYDDARRCAPGSHCEPHH